MPYWTASSTSPTLSNAESSKASPESCATDKSLPQQGVRHRVYGGSLLYKVVEPSVLRPDPLRDDPRTPVVRVLEPTMGQYPVGYLDPTVVCTRLGTCLVANRTEPAHGLQPRSIRVALLARVRTDRKIDQINGDDRLGRTACRGL